MTAISEIIKRINTRNRWGFKFSYYYVLLINSVLDL